jgi:hypothetical protein
MQGTFRRPIIWLYVQLYTYIHIVYIYARSQTKHTETGYTHRQVTHRRLKAISHRSRPARAILSCEKLFYFHGVSASIQARALIYRAAQVGSFFNSTMLWCHGVGNFQVLKSRGWGIYYILAKTIQIPAVLPGGGGIVTAGIDPCITKWLRVMYLKNTGRNSTFRAKLFCREVSPSSRSLPTNSQTKGLRSKRRISLVFPTHFHFHQPSFAIIAIKNGHSVDY